MDESGQPGQMTNLVGIRSLSCCSVRVNAAGLDLQQTQLRLDFRN